MGLSMPCGYQRDKRITFMYDLPLFFPVATPAVWLTGSDKAYYATQKEKPDLNAYRVFFRPEPSINSNYKITDCKQNFLWTMLFCAIFKTED